MPRPCRPTPSSGRGISSILNYSAHSCPLPSPPLRHSGGSVLQRPSSLSSLRILVGNPPPPLSSMLRAQADNSERRCGRQLKPLLHRMVHVLIHWHSVEWQAIRQVRPQILRHWGSVYESARCNCRLYSPKYESSDWGQCMCAIRKISSLPALIITDSYEGSSGVGFRCPILVCLVGW